MARSNHEKNTEQHCNPALRSVIETYLADVSSNCDTGHLTKLQGGFSGTGIFKFEFEGQQYVLRTFDQGERGLHTAVHRELEATCIASDLAVGSKVFYCDQVKRAIVTQFIEGKHPVSNYFDAPEHSDELLGLLRRMHQHPGESLGGFQSQSFYEHIEYRLTSCASMLSGDDGAMLRSLLEAIKGVIDCDEDPIGFCHFDLHMNNMMVDDSERLHLLDWGDAGIGSCLADLALLSIFTKRNNEQALAWLDQYLQKPSSKAMQLNFLKYRALSYLLQFTAAMEAMHNMGADHISLAECGEESKGDGMTHFDRAQLHFSGSNPIDSIEGFEEYAKLCWQSLSKYQDLIVESRPSATRK